MSAVICFTPAHGGPRSPHDEQPDCQYPHSVAPEGPTLSMTAVETLDPREAVSA